MAAAQDLAARIVALCDEVGVAADDRLSHLHDALAVIRERLNISSAKADGGTTGECWIAKHFGLVWESEKKTGADATDDQARACEIKASLHPLKTKLATHKTNICYKTPHRRDGETDDDYVARTQEHIRQNTGGHFWATWFEKTPADAADRIVLGWWVPSVPLAQLIGKKMRASDDMRKKSGSISINFGAKVCSTCGGVHRIDNIVRALGGWMSRGGTVQGLARSRHVDHVEIGAETLAALDNGACGSQCG